MIHVSIVKDWDREDDLLSQTPGSAGKWGNCYFSFKSIKECDVVIFTNRVRFQESIKCLEGGRVLLQMEPPTPAHRWYRKSDRYFDLVVGPDLRVPSGKRILSHGALPWHIGRSYDFLKELTPPQKNEHISMITSNANWMEGHVLRLAVVEAAKEGQLEFDLFGRGFRPIRDKYDAHAPYKYSLVIENSFHPHYWTEKLADCLLSWTVPIYVGAPNIVDYFPKGSIIVVPPDLSKIIQAVHSLAVDDYERRLPALAEARQLILDKYQLFPVLADVANNLELGNQVDYDFHANHAPWEGGRVGLGRRIEYRFRKLMNKRPF